MLFGMVLGIVCLTPSNAQAELVYPEIVVKFEILLKTNAPQGAALSGSTTITLAQVNSSEPITHKITSLGSDSSPCSVGLDLTTLKKEMSIQCTVKPILGIQKFSVSLNYTEGTLAKVLTIPVEVTVEDKSATERVIEKMLADFPNQTKLINEILKPKCASCETERSKARNENKKNVVKLFRKSETLNFNLDVNLIDLENKIAVAGKQPPTPATIQFECEKPLQVEVTKRGRSRRGFCKPIPPMKIRFLSEKKGSPFEGAGKTLKLVAPCYNYPKEGALIYMDRYGGPESNFEEMLNREYWIYKIIEATGLPHFKVRRGIMNINQKKIPVFFIEDDEDVIDREGGGKGEAKKEDNSRLIGENRLYNLISGTSDGGPYGHNSRSFVGKDGFTHLLRYDFDLSSLVSQEWHGWFSGVAPSEFKKISKNLDSSTLANIKTVLTHEQDVLNVIQESDLSPADKARFKDYYENLFKTLKKRSAKLK